MKYYGALLITESAERGDMIQSILTPVPVHADGPLRPLPKGTPLRQ